MNQSLKLKQFIIKNRTFLLTGLILLGALHITAQGYNSVSFYVCAHQDDWQLFMGTNVFHDISDFDEKQPAANGKKVVIIYTTSGNLNDDDDSKTCDCMDSHDTSIKHIPYWKVREEGAKNSIHFASCRMGGWGPTIPYPQYTTINIHDHIITKYEYKNTVSYFLRLKSGQYGHWIDKPDTSVGTVDSSTIYAGWADFVQTLYYIYYTEMHLNVPSGQAFFNFPDIDTSINKEDHMDHFLAGKAAAEAAKILGKTLNASYPENLYVDYYTKNLPVNLSKPDAQNEAGLTAVYCMALLDYNAWPEWGELYQEWTARNYFRTSGTFERPLTSNIPDTSDKVKVINFNSPVNKNLMVQFINAQDFKIKYSILDGAGKILREEKTRINTNNLLAIQTEFLLNGAYTASIETGDALPLKIIFAVKH